MRLLQRGKRRFTIGPLRRTTWSFRAIAAAAVLIASIVQTQSHAAIILNDRDGLTHVEGQLLGHHSDGGTPPLFIRDIDNGYDVVQPAPAGLNSFTLPGTPPQGKTTIPGASAVTNANVEATITLNTQADTLFVSAKGSVSTVVSGTITDARRDIAIADGAATFDLSFTTDRVYEYMITSGLSVGAQQVPNPSGQGAQARSTISMGGAGWFFEQDRLINCDGCDFDGGSSVGTLEPGGHSIQGTVSAGLNSFDGTSANASYLFTLQLTTASHWIDTAGGSFQVADNWFTPTVPGAPDVAVFDVPGTYTVQLDQDATNKRLRANGAGLNVSFDLNGNEYVLDEISVGGRNGDNVSITFRPKQSEQLYVLRRARRQDSRQTWCGR